jgi:uncharacterized membrane protein YkvA (DUF1232 family)
MQGPLSQFTENKLWRKLNAYARQAGIKVVYAALLLYYAYRRKDTPHWARRVVIGVLGYFLSPIDALPDLTPILGYTDDLGVLAFGLVTIAAYVDTSVKQQAREKLHAWFGAYDEEELKEVDDKV